MEIGMLWFDNDPKVDLSDKVQKAAAYYQGKYRQAPNLCFVHPSMLPMVKITFGAITVLSKQAIRPHHFWIGYQREEELQSPPVTEPSHS
jgi:hypothetical protein